MATLIIPAPLRWLGICSLLCCGCGDGQRDEQYRGPPLWSIPIGLQQPGPSVDNPSALRLALFFAPHGLGSVDPQQLVEHRGSAMPISAFGAATLTVFEPPGPEHMLQAPDGTSAGYAVGRLLAYVDEDLDRLHTPGEPFVGYAGAVALLYTPSSQPASLSPTGTDLPAGLVNLMVPQSCTKTPPVPTDPDTCGVPIGAACQVDSDCMSGGLCLHGTTMPWAAGYCTVADGPSTTCRPTRAVHMGRPLTGVTPNIAKNGYYLKPCQADLDCARMSGDQTYRCDPGLRGCVPNVGDKVVRIGLPFMIEPFCAP